MLHHSTFHANCHAVDLFSGDGTCEGVVCHFNADCVTRSNSEEPEKVCRCKPGYTGQGVICSGELNGILEFNRKFALVCINARSGHSKPTCDGKKGTFKKNRF